jgi:hypothetical protein
MLIPYDAPPGHWCPSVKSILSDARRAEELGRYMSDPQCGAGPVLRAMLEAEMKNRQWPEDVVRACLEAEERVSRDAAAAKPN